MNPASPFNTLPPSFRVPLVAIPLMFVVNRLRPKAFELVAWMAIFPFSDAFGPHVGWLDQRERALLIRNGGAFLPIL